MVQMKYIFIFFIIILFAGNTSAQPENRLGFGAEFGIMTNTINGTDFGMAFSGDYLIGPNFSLAEIISFIPSSDLTMFNAHTVARFNIPLQGFSIIPYLGIGFTYGSFEDDTGSDNAFSLAFPIGLTLTIPVAAQIEAAGRVHFALYELDYGALGTDRNYIELMVGFRYSP